MDDLMNDMATLFEQWCRLNVAQGLVLMAAGNVSLSRQWIFACGNNTFHLFDDMIEWRHTRQRAIFHCNVL